MSVAQRIKVYTTRDYVEIIEIRDLPGFGTDVKTETMRRVAAEFRQFADQPVFMLTNQIS